MNVKIKAHVNVRLTDSGGEKLTHCSKITGLSRARIVQEVFEEKALDWLQTHVSRMAEQVSQEKTSISQTTK